MIEYSPHNHTARSRLGNRGVVGSALQCVGEGKEMCAPAPCNAYCAQKTNGKKFFHMCAGPDADPFSSGSLVQQALGNSQKKRALGAAGHRIAKRLTWGDLWPDAFTKAQ